MRIEDIDPNFKLPDNMPEGIEFKNVWEEPFQIYGIADNGKGDAGSNEAGLQKVAQSIVAVKDGKVFEFFALGINIKIAKTLHR